MPKAALVRRRGLANAAIDPGTRTGPAVGTLLGGLLMAGLGWRVFFLALGLDSMLWLAVWLFFMPDGRTVAVQKDEGDPPGVAGILCQRSAWFSFFGLFCGALATIILPVSVVRSDATAMVLLMLASAFIGMWSSNL